AFQLELDLADPFAGLLAGGADRAAVDRGFDARARGRPEVGDQPSNLGSEDRRHPFGDFRGQKTPAFTSKRVGALAGDRVCPLAAGKGRAARLPRRLYRLDVKAVMAA